jgi:uncharacterized membrane protein (TIGR01666 family)
MDYVRQYKRFINSHYLNGAIRITAGITLPAILLGYFNNLSAGIVLSIGAMCVANTDNPGPIHHRRNGMIACVLIIFLVTVVTGWASGSAVMTGLLVVVFCFVFSLMSIYGNRASSIGVNALLVMVLNLDRRQQGWHILINAAYVLAGGVWYTVLSLLLYSFRPYKLVQQALGDCVQATADFLRIKASFYSRDVDYDKSYRQLLDSQITIQEKQDLLRELIFKSRKIVQESTHTGRVLMMIFLDIVDLFERIMTSQQDYRLLHQFFDDSGLMEECRLLILDLATELDGIGLAIMSGRPSVDRSTLSTRIGQLRESFDRYRQQWMGRPDYGADLGNILDSIQDINDRLHVLHGFTTYDRKLSRNFKADLDYSAFVAHQDMDRKLIIDNLTLDSNIFRHSLRVSIATFAGYIISLFLPFGHGYWILLTVIVILKPSYSLSKKRNVERLMGTLGGALVGLLLIYVIKDRNVLFVLMILFMCGTYVFIRTNYLVCVTLMTPYVLLLFHLLYPTGFRSVISDRVIDTLIGSGLAFLASISIIPNWEHEKMTDFMTAALKTNIDYFRDVSVAFLGRPATVQQYKLSRKHAFVALANLSDAFGRMLSEPQRQQKKVTEMHQFVVSNHMLTSYIATLAYYMDPLAMKHANPALQPVVDDITLRLESSVDILEERTREGAAEIPEGYERDGPWRSRPNEVLSGSSVRKNGQVSQEAGASGESGPRPAEAGGPLQSRSIGVTRGGALAAELQPVADQFGFIAKVTSDIRKLSVSLRKALP